MITRVDTVVLYVADQQRSLEFYVDKLGFQKHTDAEMSPGRRWLSVLPPGAETQLVLFPADPDYRRPEGLSWLTFTCDDVEKTYQELRARGVEVSEPTTEPWGTYLRLTDPDGYVFVVGQQH
jgi:catechol 2,3-dioxygenase-like lactoylglutathione lyase family enzyme